MLYLLGILELTLVGTVVYLVSRIGDSRHWSAGKTLLITAAGVFLFITIPLSFLHLSAFEKTTSMVKQEMLDMPYDFIDPVDNESMRIEILDADHKKVRIKSDTLSPLFDDVFIVERAKDDHVKIRE